MKASLVAFAVALAAAQPVAAQSTTDRATPQRTTLPPGGLTLDFNEIDRNGDKIISVEEWNAFIDALRAKTAQQGSTGAATGTTAAPREPKR